VNRKSQGIKDFAARKRIAAPRPNQWSHTCVHPRWTQGFPDEDEESLLPQSLGVLENGHYTVELCRASKPNRHCFFYLCALVQSRIRLNCLYLNQDGIKRGRVAHVGKYF
jgi:hypothetical protein